MVSGSRINKGGYKAAHSIEYTIKELNEVIKNINRGENENGKRN